MMKSDELKQLSHGATIKKKQKKRTIELNEKIRECTKTFNETRDVGQFLNEITWDQNFEDFFYKPGNSEHASEDDEIIPNDFNAKSNFKSSRAHRAVPEKRRKTIDDKIHAKRQKIA